MPTMCRQQHPFLIVNSYCEDNLMIDGHTQTDADNNNTQRLYGCVHELEWSADETCYTIKQTSGLC